MKKEKGLGAWLLIALAALFLCAMLVLPLVLVVHEALARGAAAYLSAVTEPFAVKAVRIRCSASRQPGCSQSMISAARRCSAPSSICRSRSRLWSRACSS